VVLLSFYVAVLSASGGWEHLQYQARKDWWLLAPDSHPDA
jgi:hypothetical protein